MSWETWLFVVFLLLLITLALDVWRPFTGVFNGSNVYVFEPLPNWIEPDPWCKYNSPSDNTEADALDIPLRNCNIAAIN